MTKSSHPSESDVVSPTTATPSSAAVYGPAVVGEDDISNLPHGHLSHSNTDDISRKK